MVTWAFSLVFQLLGSSNNTSLYELLRGQDPAGLGGFAPSTSLSPLTFTEDLGLVLSGHKETSDELKGILNFQGEV